MSGYGRFGAPSSQVSCKVHELIVHFYRRSRRSSWAHLTQGDNHRPMALAHSNVNPESRRLSHSFSHPKLVSIIVYMFVLLTTHGIHRDFMTGMIGFVFADGWRKRYLYLMQLIRSTRQQQPGVPRPSPRRWERLTPNCYLPHVPLHLLLHTLTRIFVISLVKSFFITNCPPLEVSSDPGCQTKILLAFGKKNASEYMPHLAVCKHGL